MALLLFFCINLIISKAIQKFNELFYEKVDIFYCSGRCYADICVHNVTFFCFLDILNHLFYNLNNKGGAFVNKKIVITSALLLVLLFALCSCSMTERNITFVLGDGREDVVTKVTINSALYEPEPLDENVSFGGWFLDEECTIPYLSKNILEDLTLYARWVSKGTKSVTFVFDNGKPNVTYFYEGGISEPMEPTKEGFVFGGWIDAATSKAFDFSAEPTSNLVLKAKWNKAPTGLTVTFDPCNGDEKSVYTVVFGGTMHAPAAPEKEGYTFAGWYNDVNYSSPYDFSMPIRESKILYARWSLGSTDFGNYIATEAMLSTLRIETYRYNLGMIGQVNGSYTSNGSGVIFRYADGKYYCLTNDHVVKLDSDYEYTSYSVFDCYGNKYEAQLIATDPAYDLAVLCFEKSKELSVATLASANAGAGTLIASVGNPNGMINSVTYGIVGKYDIIDLENSDSGEVSFAVGWHNAPVDHGSSGGAVFGENMTVVGINFAAGSNSDGEFLYGFFIPAEKVLEFISSLDLLNENIEEQ